MPAAPDLGLGVPRPCSTVSRPDAAWAGKHDDGAGGALENRCSMKVISEITLGLEFNRRFPRRSAWCWRGGGRHLCLLVQLGPYSSRSAGRCGRVWRDLPGQTPRPPARIANAGVNGSLSGNLGARNAAPKFGEGATRRDRQRRHSSRRAAAAAAPSACRASRQPQALNRGHRPPERGHQPPVETSFGRHAPSAGLARPGPHLLREALLDHRSCCS